MTFTKWSVGFVQRQTGGQTTTPQFLIQHEQHKSMFFVFGQTNCRGSRLLKRFARAGTDSLRALRWINNPNVKNLDPCSNVDPDYSLCGSS